MSEVHSAAVVTSSYVRGLQGAVRELGSDTDYIPLISKTCNNETQEIVPSTAQSRAQERVPRGKQVAIMQVLRPRCLFPGNQG